MMGGDGLRSSAWRVARRDRDGARWAGCAVCVIALTAALLGSVFAQASDAGGLGFSFTPSKAEPYAVCGHPTPGHAACLAIIVPRPTALSSAGVLQPATPAVASPPLAGGGVGGGYDPDDLQSAYNLPSASAGSGQTVAIVDAYDDPKAESDLDTYRSHYGLSACTTANGCFKKVNQTGGTSYPKANASWSVEISLDLDMASAACPNCHILLVEATSNANTNLYTAENEAATLGATEISNSWGGEEFSGETSDDSYFHHTGVLISASAGDSGYEVEYPAASQYVIAVGGTNLVKASNSRGWSETAWDRTGSGCSKYESKPAWQTDKDCTNRTNNDVAAVAGTETPVSVADSYELPREFSIGEPGWTLVGGTSVSSPLIAGTMALSNAYTKSFTGANALYKEASQNGTGVLDDVTSGSNVKEGKESCGNYLCEAGPGYDGPTGLGSPYGAPVVLPNAPAVVTKAASSVTQTAATLNATVNPESGEVSKCEFEYGETSSYGKLASCASLPGSGSSPIAVSASPTGLTADTTYHFRITATNAGGTSRGADETFKTLPNAPAVVTDAASSVAQTTVTLNATVNPNGAEVAKCEFEYGETNSYGKVASCASLPGSGTSAVAVSAAVSGLTASTTYHFRISATNLGGTSTGADERLTTLRSCPPAGFCESFGASGEALEGHFAEPEAVAVDSSGNIWVADSGHDRVLAFNSAHQFVRQFGSEGTGEGQFEGIRGIATNKEGDVYVSDYGNDRIQEFSPAGVFIRKFGSLGTGAGQLAGPTAVAVDSSGNVWVLDTYGVLAQEFSSTGVYVSGFGTAVAFDPGLAISGGNLYITEAGNAKVHEYSTTGASIATFDERGTGTGKSSEPWAIATDPTTGNLYVSDIGNNNVQEFSAAGGYIATFGSAGYGAGQLSDAKGLAVGPTGVVYVADTANQRVEVWAAPKTVGEPPTFSASFGTAGEALEGRFAEPEAVAVDSSGNIWVADSGHDRVLEFNSARKFLRQFGSEGTAEGQFKGIATNKEGDVYVSDYGNNRIQEFSPAGVFIRKFGTLGTGAGQLAGPTAVAVDASGNVWVLNTYGVLAQEFSSTGVYVSGFGTAVAFSADPGLAISGGNLYITEAGNAKVHEYSTTGTSIATFDERGTGTGKSSEPWAVATDPTTGNLYVSDAGNNNVQEFSATGSYIATFGSAGYGAGQLSNPKGLAVGPTGFILIADTNNNNIEEWTPGG